MTTDQLVGRLADALAEMFDGDELRPGSPLWFALNVADEAKATAMLHSYARQLLDIDDATADAVLAQLGETVDFAGSTAADVDQL